MLATHARDAIYAIHAIDAIVAIYSIETFYARTLCTPVSFALYDRGQR